MCAYPDADGEDGAVEQGREAMAQGLSLTITIPGSVD